MAMLEGHARPAWATGDDRLSRQEVAAAGPVEQKKQLCTREAREEIAATVAFIGGTIMLLEGIAQTLLDGGHQPALRMLHLSSSLCLLLCLWVHLSIRALLFVLAWIISAIAVSVGLADTATGIVAAMQVMYVVTLCIAGLYAWCLGEYLRIRYDRTARAGFSSLQ